MRLTLAEAMGGETDGEPEKGLSLSQFSQLLASSNAGLSLYDARTGRPRASPEAHAGTIAGPKKPAAGCTACLVC